MSMNRDLHTLFAMAVGEEEVAVDPGVEYWHALTECARAEDLRGLLYYRTVSADLPAEIRAELMEDYRAPAESTVLQLHEFMEIGGALRDRKLEVLVLPGASLL